MYPNQNDSNVVVVSPDTDSRLLARQPAPRWPLALAGLCLLGLGIAGLLAFYYGRTNVSLQDEVAKLRQSNQTLNEENAKVKQLLDEQMQTERTKTLTLETQVQSLQTQANEWTTLQGAIGGTGYRPSTTPPAEGAEEPAVNVTSMMKVFRLDMNLPKLPDYPEYTADITGPAGQKPSLIKVTKAANGVAIMIASSGLTDGKYTVKLSGKKDGIGKELGKAYLVNLVFPK